MLNYREVSKGSVVKLIYVYLYLDEIAIVIVILVIERVYDATIMKFNLYSIVSFVL